MAKPREKNNIKKLVLIMKTLRGPKGCPWDKKQTSQSIISHLIEESHEAQEALLKGDDKHFCEELGDILLQIVFHAQIAEEEGRFTLEDICEGICKKLTH